MSDNLDELRAAASKVLAEEAHEFGWHVGTEATTYGTLSHVYTPDRMTDLEAHRIIATNMSDTDAQYLASLHPARLLALLSRLEQAEQQVADLESKIEGENLRWVAWEMVENSGQVDLSTITWMNHIAEDLVSLDAAKYHFFGGAYPCEHLGGDDPFDIDDEGRPACEHCNRRALDGDGRG